MLDKFPGLLNYGKIIAVHADWPIYPMGTGWELAMMALVNYPPETEFYQIGNIDKCLLLINQPPAQLTDKFDDKFFHVAVWEEDLLELARKKLIEGVTELSEYSYDKFKFGRFKKEIIKTLRVEHKNRIPEDANGNIILHCDINGNKIEYQYKKPVPEDYDESDLMDEGYIIIPEKICITQNGWNKINEIYQCLEWHGDLASIVDPLLSINRFDTAIREASLLIETSIRKFHNSQLFGAKLVDHHLNDIVKYNDNFRSAALKCYRGELRTLFSFIRNEFAHNFKVLTEEQCRMILYRINQVYNDFLEIRQVYYKLLH